MPVGTTAAWKILVPTSGLMTIVTWTEVALGRTPDGSASGTSTLSVPVTAPTGIGWVSARAIGARTSGSPSTVTTVGSTVTDSIEYPVGGVPLVTGFTASVRVWLFRKTGILIS